MLGDRAGSAQAVSTAFGPVDRGSDGEMVRRAPQNGRMLDATDVALLQLLHADARLSVATLARRLSMSASATRERIRRLEDLGVITGYHAALSADQLGFPLLAFVRLRYPTSNYKPLHDLLGATPEVLEAHHVTGDDCFVLKVAARDMRDLERLAGRIASLGSVTTSLVYSTLVDSRPPPTAPVRAGARGPTAPPPTPGPGR